MFSIAGIDLLEQELLDHERTLLEILLQDKTTKKNIIWATDDYAELGEPYSFKKEILPELVTGEQDSLIQPRVEKALEHQTNRTRDKAEVFTPSWICNAQNNLVDEQWFGRKDVFNIQKEMSWKATADKIAFPDDRQHTWQKYVDAQRLEISCGEAPYLVSRYDTVTGETIPISQRIGLLDRKLRVIGENTDTEEEWLTWTKRAFQSVYGFEYQGDSLLLARENLFVTFVEVYRERFGKLPHLRQMKVIANIIAWNLWQMDGTQMTAYSVSRMMRQIKRLTVDRAIKSGFDDESVYKQDTGIVMDEEDVQLFHTLSDKLSEQKAAKKETKVHINNQGLTGEEYEKAEKLSNKPKRERSKEDDDLLKKLQDQRKEREKVIRLLRNVSIRLPLLIYGAKVDLTESIKMADFITLVDEESWQEFMPKTVDKPLFRKLLKYYDEDVVSGAGLRIRRMAKAADELPPTERVKRIAEIFSHFRNPDKETVLTPWRVVNLHLSSMVGGYCFLNEQFDSQEVLEEPRLVDQGQVTEDIFLNPEAQILEMNSKSGLYPLYMAYSLYAMKLPGPEDKLPLEQTQALWQETVEQQIFVLCKTRMAESITRRTLVGYQDWTVNTTYIPHLLERMENDPQRLAKKLQRTDTWGKEGQPMKFDAIVGNPPYQLMGGSGGTNDAPIYQYFASLAEEVEPHYISLIIPSRWFSAGRKNLLGDFRTQMLANRKIRKMYVYPSSQDIFPTVDIKGGLCYYLIDNGYDGDCEYTLAQNGKEKTTTRSLNDLDILVREPELANIVKKVMSGIAETDTVSTIVSNDTPFGIPTNPKTSGKNATVVYEDSTPEHNVKLLYLDNMVRTIAYVSRESIKKNTGDIDCPKVFIPEAAGSGNDPYVVGKPEYIGETAVCSQTFLYVAFKTEMEAKNFISYLKTRFFRVLVSACKISQHTPSSTYRFVPLQDFSKSWTDEELYKKYELTEDEIAFIESTIRVME